MHYVGPVRSIGAFREYSGRLHHYGGRYVAEYAADGTVVWTEANPSGITYNASLSFQTLPKYEDTPRKRRYVQSIEYAAGGDPYVFTREVPARQPRELSWGDMVKSDWGRLADFIDILRGATYTFAFTDEDGNTHDALILNSDDIRSAAATDGLVGLISLQLLLLG